MPRKDDTANTSFEKGKVNLVKTVTFTKGQWQQVGAHINELKKGSTFSQELTEIMHNVLKAPLIRSEKHLDPDLLYEKNETEHGEVDILIVTKLKLKVHLLKGTVTEGATCIHKFLGPYGCAKIPGYVPEHFCSSAAQKLGLFFTKLEYPPGERNDFPGPGDFLRKGEQFEIRLITGRRFWAPFLVVSKQAKSCGALNKMNFCVCPELSSKDPEMYLVIPAFEPEPGEELQTTVTFDLFKRPGGIDQKRAETLNEFFFGANKGEIKLVAEDVLIRGDKGVVPAAFATPDQLHDVIDGCDPTPQDIHGVAAHAKAQCIELRKKSGIQVLGMWHRTLPLVKKPETLPPECELLGGNCDDMESLGRVMLECPVGPHTVMYPDSQSFMLFLKTDTAERGAIDLK